MTNSNHPYDRSVRSLDDADRYADSGESEYTRERADPYQMLDYLMDRGVDFRGRGPKGFTISDSRIYERVCEILLRDPAIDASEIEVEVKNGMVTLRGKVSSRQSKRLVEMSLESLPGVKDILNRLQFPH